MPVLVTIFNTRVKLIEYLLHPRTSRTPQQVKADLQAQIRVSRTDAFTVKKVLPSIQQAWQPDVLDPRQRGDGGVPETQVGPLLRLAADVDVAAETFTSKMERLKLQTMQHSPKPRHDAVHRRRCQPHPAYHQGRPAAPAAHPMLLPLAGPIAPQRRSSSPR